MMRMLIFLLLLSTMAIAQSDPAQQARAASDLLEDATAQLKAAEGARDRVRSLTKTIQAFEVGLAAMRDGLRKASLKEAQLSAKLSTRDDEIADLLAVLQSIGGQPSPVIFLHPGGPTGTARAGMLLAELTPALNARATSLRRDLEDVQILRSLQNDASQRMQQGLEEIQSARASLNQAMANRTELPKRFTNDPVRAAILLASSETLEGFASGLARIAIDETSVAPPTGGPAKGEMALPVQGIILRAAGEPDAAGVSRPGIILATRPNAIVISPAAATVRYAGPLLDFGQVVIMEPSADVLFVFAGLESVYGEAGEVVDAGTPLGLMGKKGAKNGAELSIDGDDTGTERSETLYIEVRQDNLPEDPVTWFRTDKDG